ncbi:MAG: vitamin B12-dependent ribonucleotide reductase [Planctomycetes bacterium]|nr:vitamin B12-dependent ribonucleotide reductase [Planctomycetota bacterium]
MSEALTTERDVRVVKDDTQASELGLSENALRVLRARYLKKDEHGRYTESATELFRRVARAIADAELLYDSSERNRSEWEDRFFTLMTSRRFMPNSPTLMNAGREMGMLSACFVLPVGDSIDEIFDSIKHTALIQKAGGGTGFAFDELRPTGDYISSSGGTTSGPISFWRAFSEATNAIQQGAFRRGANMGMMNIHHPDILKFLHAKEDLTQFTNYNISVKVTDEWMNAFLGEPDGPHLVRNPRTGRTYGLPKDLGIWEYGIRSLVETRGDGTLPPGDYYTRRDIWNIIIRNAHRTGEPGVVFIDRVNQHNPTPHVGSIEATNPCGEQPLLPYEACNLGSVNLAEFVRVGRDGAPWVDWDDLRAAVHESTRFLDDVIDANRYPLEEIDAICKRNRKIGLGVMGFADALYKLGVPYNSDEGVAWGERFMKFVNDESHNYSEKLARERGCFPNWTGSIYDTKFHRPMRNATCSTVAPTGTISIIAGCSGGIEPMYSLAFFRNVLRGQDEGKAPMVEINPIFEQAARDRGFLSEGLMERVATDGTLANAPEVPDDVKRLFVCAHDIAPEWHMRMQAAFQRHCDASISKTINFPETATVEDVAAIYRMAYELDCKGVTVYRNGCRKHQPMALKSSDEAHARSAAGRGADEGEVAARPAPPAKPEFRALEPAELPEIMSGVRVRQLTPFGNMHINITVDPKTGREMEVFAQLGKGGDLANSDLEAICRLISLWLRSGGSLNHVVRQLHSIGSSLQVQTKEGKIMSLGDGLARALRRYMRAKADTGLMALLTGESSADAVAKKAAPAEAGGRANGSGNGSRGNGNGGGHGRNATPAAAQGAAQPDAAPGARLWSRFESDQVQWQQKQYKVVCPDCQGPLRFGEGCVTCDACGFSKC